MERLNAFNDSLAQLIQDKQKISHSLPKVEELIGQNNKSRIKPSQVGNKSDDLHENKHYQSLDATVWTFSRTYNLRKRKTLKRLNIIQMIR
jgi:hypothetical protein